MYGIVLWGVVNASVESRAAGLPAELYSMDDDYRALLDANLLSAAAVTSAFLPLLVASRGRVINTGCLTGLVNIPANAAYSASMSALLAWSESLRYRVCVSTSGKQRCRRYGNSQGDYRDYGCAGADWAALSRWVGWSGVQVGRQVKC